MPGTLDGKVALVTGGNSGIGKATALAFTREGAKVVVAARRIPEGEETVRVIKEQGGDAIFAQTDVSKAAEVEALITKTVQTFGRLDYASNNAGMFGPPSTVVDHLEEDWDRVLSVNLKSVWLCMKYEIPQMLTHAKGAIVNHSSMVGLVGGRLSPAYVASKHGVVGLTKVAALQYAQQGIRINALCAGVIRTPMVESLFNDTPEMEEQLIGLHPIGRLGTPEEVAEAGVWLCSDAASFVTGHAMSVDGGWVAQ